VHCSIDTRDLRMSIRIFSWMRSWQLKHCFMRELHCEHATWWPQGRNVTATVSLVHIMHRFLPSPAPPVVVCCWRKAGFGATTGWACFAGLFTVHTLTIIKEWISKLYSVHSQIYLFFYKYSYIMREMWNFTLQLFHIDYTQKVICCIDHMLCA